MKAIGKRVLSLLLSILLIAGCCVVAGLPRRTVQAETFTSGDYEYTLLEDGTAQITDYTGSDTDLTIPAQLDGHPVTEIGSFAFQYQGLTSVVLPEGITAIGAGAFEYCNFTYITIPDSVTDIGSGAFSYCESLTSISLPSRLTAIESQLFQNCISLTSVVIPEGVNRIGDSAFGTCLALTSVTLPSTVVSIGEWAFSRCESLSQLTLPNGMMSIGDFAFDSCDGFTSFTIPASVTQIGEDIFRGCDHLTCISVAEDNPVYSSQDGVLFNKDKTTLLRCPQGWEGSYAVPHSVTEIGNYGFSYCAGLTGVSMPEGLLCIGQSAFERCNGLTSLILPETVEELGIFAFDYCENLALINIPGSLKEIGNCAFAGCRNLAGNIVLPAGVETIPYHEFENCTSLPAVTIPVTVTSIGNGAFYNCRNLTDVYYTGTQEQWNQIVIGSDNDFLHNATIHFGSAASGETITSSITLEAGTGRQVFLSASGRNLAENQVAVASRDEEVVSAQLQWVQVVSSAGENPLQTLVVSAYLTANQLGQAQVQVSYPGGQQIIQVTVTESQAPEVPANFDEATYHADRLLDSTTPGNWSMEDTLDYLNSPLGTPSRIFLTGLEDGLFEEAVLAWEGLDDLSLAVNDPTGLIDKEVKVQDLYSAMILQSLRASFEIGLADSMADSLSTQQSVLGQVTNLLRTKYNIKMLGNKMDPSTYASLSLELKREINEDIQQTFEENCPLTAATEVFKGFNLGIEVFDTIEDYVEYIYNGATLIALSDSAKAALQEMYRQCPASNYALKLALQDCIQIMNSGTAEFLANAATRSMQSVGWQAAKYLVGQLWGTVMDLAQKTLPGVGYLMLAYDGAKLLTNGLFNTDATITSYYKMRIMTELEGVSSAAYRSLASQYRQSRSVEDAQTLLSCGEILFQIMDSDCVEADGFVSTLDEAGITAIAKLFGCENNYDAVRASIEEIRKSNDLNRYTAATNWIYYLEEDYPDSGMYEAYSYRFDQEQQKMVGKEYRVACPVDVLVYNSNTGELAASVVDGRIQNNVPEDLTLILEGEEKVLWAAPKTEYRIVLVGSGAGTMDITVKEFDEQETAIRTVSYDNVALTDGKTYETTLDSQTLAEDSYILADRSDGGVVDKTQDTLDFQGETYTLQVNSGLATVDGKQGTTLEVAPGQLVTVTAYVPEGTPFLGWQITQGSGVLADSGAVSTTFRMPAEDVILTASVGKNQADVNGDSQVDVADVMALAQLIVNGSTDTQYDLNRDGFLNVLDVMTLAQQIVNQTVSR